jgi:F0F1-type ATP synthase alpha subunit
LFAANEGLLDDVNDLRIKDFKNGWFDFFEANMKDLIQRLDAGEELSDEDKIELTKMVNKYKTNFFK